MINNIKGINRVMKTKVVMTIAEKIAGSGWQSNWELQNRMLKVAFSFGWMGSMEMIFALRL